MTAILLAYDAIAGARDHFVDRLGFTEAWSTSDATDVTRAHVRLGDTLLMLDRPGAHGLRRPTEAGGVTHLVVIAVDDIDEHHRHAIAAGIATRTPPTDRPARMCGIGTCMPSRMPASPNPRAAAWPKPVHRSVPELC